LDGVEGAHDADTAQLEVTSYVRLRVKKEAVSEYDPLVENRENDAELIVPTNEAVSAVELFPENELEFE
jgi:hypothetical protein